MTDAMQSYLDDMAWAATAEAEAAGDRELGDSLVEIEDGMRLGSSLMEMQNELLRVAVLNNRLGYAVEALANGAELEAGVEAMTEKVLAFAEADGLGIAYQDAYMAAYGAMVRLGIAAELESMGGAELDGDLIDRMVANSLALEAERLEIEAPTHEEIEIACGRPDPVGEMQSVGRIAI